MSTYRREWWEFKLYQVTHLNQALGQWRFMVKPRPGIGGWYVPNACGFYDSKQEAIQAGHAWVDAQPMTPAANRALLSAKGESE